MKLIHLVKITFSTLYDNFSTFHFLALHVEEENLNDSKHYEFKEIKVLCELIVNSIHLKPRSSQKPKLNYRNSSVYYISYCTTLTETTYELPLHKSRNVL